jgi:hypothetical protein
MLLMMGSGPLPVGATSPTAMEAFEILRSSITIVGDRMAVPTGALLALTETEAGMAVRRSER